MLRPIKYPNTLEDIVVIEFRGLRKIGFTVRPKLLGRYRLLAWPEAMPDPDLFVHSAMVFSSDDGPPYHCVFDLARHAAKDMSNWHWALVKAELETTALTDFADAVSKNRVVTNGRFELFVPDHHREARTIAWSCHMPYDTNADGQAILDKDSEAMLEWFESETRNFRPHSVWGGGDSCYSDGTEGTDFSDQVYDKGRWYSSPANREWLRNEFRKMYRHFWSLAPMNRVMKEFPHLFIWDDHEIHDGWGSEGKDFEQCNIELFKIAKEVANEYILTSGPRIRRGGVEAHQAYTMGSMAAFIFDTRSTRNYEAPRNRLISRQQFDDFRKFLDIIARRSDITDLVTCTTVPFVNMRSWVMELGTRAPDFLNDNVIQGVRDDIRDSWTSPGNIDTLEAVLSVFKFFMQKRSDIRVWNVSGDIHVANAYEIFVPGARRPIYQVTTSAITNRHHPPELVEVLTEIKDGSYIKGVGQVRRIWETITEPNILCIRIGPVGAEMKLRVWSAQPSNTEELVLKV